jgi:hypothetical protein
VFVAILAAGCTGGSATPQTIYITPSPAPVTPLPSGVTPAPTAVLVVPAIDSVVIASDAPDSRWKVTFKKPVISGVSAAAATKMNDAITAQINGYISAFTGSGLPSVGSGAGPSTLDGDFTIALDSPTVISLRFTQQTYVSGSDHTMGTPGSANFVVSTGAAINLADLFVDPTAALPTLSSKAHSALFASLGSELTWAGPATAISFFSKAWAMTQTGLEFNWAQGQVASAASGMPSATLPWSGIKALIKPTSPAGVFTH